MRREIVMRRGFAIAYVFQILRLPQYRWFTIFEFGNNEIGGIHRHLKECHCWKKKKKFDIQHRISIFAYFPPRPFFVLLLKFFPTFTYCLILAHMPKYGSNRRWFANAKSESWYSSILWTLLQIFTCDIFRCHSWIYITNHLFVIFDVKQPIC